MTCEELLEKYQAVLLENGILRETIGTLNTKLGVTEHRAIPCESSDNTSIDSLFPIITTFTDASDQQIVWYGSINLLSFGSAEESIMRLDSPSIANELIMSMHK